MKNVVIMPVYNPDFRLLQKVKEIQQSGLTDVVIVDDGSDPGCQHTFEQLHEMGCHLFHHSVNIGFGAAVKTGIKKIRTELSDITGYITVEDYLQNSAYDIWRVSQAMSENPDKVILTARDYDADCVPRWQQIGFKIANLIFHYSKHINCPDALSGLRGFPASLADFLLVVPGVRFEYGLHVLSVLTKQNQPMEILTIPAILKPEKSIATYQPVPDSVKIYRTLIRFGLASISCTILDLFLFTCFLHIIPVFLAHTLAQGRYRVVFSSTFAARIISGLTNFTINRKWSFQTSQRWFRQIVKYLCVFIVQMTASATLVSLLSYFFVTLTPVKLLVDLVLFFFSYRIQSKWVFQKT
jgi:putative flippase GtrA